MAKHETNSGKSKVKLLYAEFEGSDSAIETLAQTFAKALQPPTRVITRTLPPPGASSPQPNAGTAADDQTDPNLFTGVDGQVVDSDAVADENVVTEDADRTTKRTRGERKPISYAFVRDLNLRPEGKQTLRDFFAAKAPHKQQEQITVILYYLTKILGLSGVNANHIFTGFKDVGKRPPGDILGVARNTASRRGWVDSSDSDNLRLTPHGENHVDHDLPQAGTAQPAQ